MMSDVVTAAVKALNEKLGGNGFDGIAKFEIEDEGEIVIDESGARASDDAADVTLSASADTFQDILAGNLDATSAFMTGRLKLDGDMGLAMRLGSVLS
jgi:putative sterol carrier protein